MMFNNIFDIFIQRNLIACTGSFFLGIITAKFYDFFKKIYIVVISLIINIILTYVNIPYLIIIIRQIHGFSLLLFLLFIGNYLMNTKLKTFFIELSKISYGMFLFQNKIIDDIKRVFPGGKWYSIILLILFIILLTIICAKILSIVTNSIFQSDLFKFFESKIISNKKESVLHK